MSFWEFCNYFIFMPGSSAYSGFCSLTSFPLFPLSSSTPSSIFLNCLFLRHMPVPTLCPFLSFSFCFSYSFPLPLLYFLSLSSRFLHSFLFSCCLYLASLEVFMLEANTLNHPLLIFSLVALFSSLKSSLAFRFPHSFPAPILILCFSGLIFLSFLFLISRSVGPAGKRAGQSVCV